MIRNSELGRLEPGKMTVNYDGILEIRIWADVACPWCWIGERRLRRALAERSGLEVRKYWRPFELQPGLPPEGVAWEDFVRDKWDTLDRARFLLDHVTALGAEEGLEFRFDRMTRAPNTRRAHALILAAADGEAQWGMAERLFRAHFTQGRNISDPDTLRELAREEGMPDEAVRRALEGAGDHAAVTESQAEAWSLGAQGVPFFVLAPGGHAAGDGPMRLTGAQPPEVLIRALDSAVGQPQPHDTG